MAYELHEADQIWIVDENGVAKRINMAANTVLVKVQSSILGLTMAPGSILVRDFTTPTPDIRELVVAANRIVSTNSAGNWRAQSFTAGKLIRADAFGGLEVMAISAKRWLMSDAAGDVVELLCVANAMTIGDATGLPTFLIIGAQGIVGRKGGNVLIHTVTDDVFVGKDGATDWGNLSMATARDMLGLKYSSLLMPVGLYVNKLNTTTGLTAGSTYFQYVGKAGGTITTTELMTRVTTATSGGTWAEVGIFTGVFVANGNASLTRRGFTDVISTYNSTGQKKTTVALSGVSEGDDLWIAFGSSNGINFQFRGLFADDLQTGVFQSVVGRLSTLASPVATTLESATKVPAWIGAAV